MAKTQRPPLKYQIQIKQITDKVKVMDATGKFKTSYKMKSLVIPVYEINLSLEQIKKIIEETLNSAEKLNSKIGI